MAAVDLSDFVDSMRREVTPLGTTLFSGVTDDELVGYMADAFWEARMDGFFKGFVADEDGVVTDEDDITVTFSRGDVALVIVYAGIRILRNRILNTQTGFRAKAGPVEFETQASATMLAEMLKQLRDTKNRIIDEIETSGGTPVEAWDWVCARPQFYFEGYNRPAIGG